MKLAQCFAFDHCRLNSRRRGNGRKLLGASTLAWISLTDNRPQQSHTLQNVWDFHPFCIRAFLTVRVDSREDQDTAQPTITGQQEAWPPFGKAWYAGCTTLIIGNSLKAGISAFSEIDWRRNID
jgi:hypothetical protein